LISSLPSLRFRTASFTLPRASGSTPVDKRTDLLLGVSAGLGLSIDAGGCSTARAMVIDFFIISPPFGDPLACAWGGR
jgi:hypothetical protein